MRIARFYPFLPPKTGGVEQHVAQLSVAQRQMGDQVSVFYSTGSPVGPYDQQVARGAALVGRPGFVRDALFYAACLVRIRRRHLTADVVHIHGDWSAFALGTFARRLLRARKSVASIHGNVRAGRLSAILYRRALRSYDLVYATGAADAAALERMLGRQVLFLTSRVSLSLYARSPSFHERSPRVATIGRMVKGKNLDLILVICKALPHLNFMIVGAGPEELALRRAASDVPNVTFTGWLSPDRVAEILLDSRALLSVSLREGTPTTVLEGFAAGTPAVLTPSNDFTWVASANAGVVTPSWDVPSIVGALRLVTGNEAVWTQMSQSARRLASEASWEALAGTLRSHLWRVG